ncbi:glycosyltransferase family 2 protein [Nocardioides hwasunensis]|uniref:Glycosyltransferase family 2 protein n=2 Tax=Nocardioides hwasunensis TaxID=397258 RepID=A0ABR8MFX2_9ACTN|nr:galactosyltransferase-related protein [Nocardioides hwasunensis]MBD3914852.1 glycosyltransferase family 2 protein [Nocardioides hwasunensis]
MTAVVTIAHRRHEHLRRQRESLLAGTRHPDLHVVVALDDPTLEAWQPAGSLPTVVVRGPADQRGLPLAASRNLGASVAIDAGATVVIGLDVDCLVGAGLVASYADAVRSEPDVLWSGPVTYLPPSAREVEPSGLADLDDPHPARPAPGPGQRWSGGDPDLFWSLSYAVHADAWARVGGFWEEYAGYGGEDTDLGHSWVASGRTLGWLGDARAYHQHHPTETPPTQHLDAILRNGAIFARRWGRWPMGGWLEAFEELGLVDRLPGGGWTRRSLA